MNVLYYEEGFSPKVISISCDLKNVSKIIGGNIMKINMGNDCVIICNDKQTKRKPRKKTLNRVVIVPVINDKVMSGVESKYVCGNFFICSDENGLLKDFPKSRYDEIIALCGE